METRHGTQLEDMRRSLEENWKRFCADLEESDARITELGQQISILSRSPNLTVNGPGTSVTAQVMSPEKLALMVSILGKQIMKLQARLGVASDSCSEETISQLERRPEQVQADKKNKSDKDFKIFRSGQPVCKMSEI